MKVILIGLAVVFSGLIAYFIRSEKIEAASATGTTLTDKEISEASASSQQSAAIAQQAEQIAKTAESASAYQSIERQLAVTQAEAILSYGLSSAVSSAVRIEQDASIQRADLEARWAEALKIASGEMDKAQNNLNDIAGAYEKALNVVIHWLDEAKWANVAVQKFNALVQSAPTIHERTVYAAKVSEYRSRWSDFMLNAQNAKNSASRIRIEYSIAYSAMNSIIERVLTISADIHLLGILLSLADRTDKIAIATRTSVSSLHNRILALESQT